MPEKSTPKQGSWDEGWLSYYPLGANQNCEWLRLKPRHNQEKDKKPLEVRSDLILTEKRSGIYWKKLRNMLIATRSE